MSVEERSGGGCPIAQLNRAEDPRYQADLDRRLSAMDSGRKTGAVPLTKMHDDLAAQRR